MNMDRMRVTQHDVLKDANMLFKFMCCGNVYTDRLSAELACARCLRQMGKTLFPVVQDNNGPWP